MIEEIRKHPGATEAICAAPHCGWPARGLTVWGSDNCAITASYDFDDLSKAQFTSFTHRRFNYCPTADWADWVALAKNIVAIDAAFGGRGPAREAA